VTKHEDLGQASGFCDSQFSHHVREEPIMVRLQFGQAQVIQIETANSTWKYNAVMLFDMSNSLRFLLGLKRFQRNGIDSAFQPQSR